MLVNLQWDTLQLRRQASRLTLMQKIVTGQVTIPAQKLLTPVARHTRKNNTKAFNRPQATKSCYKDSFIPKTISEWNTLPEQLVNLTATDIFKDQVTSHLRKTQQRCE